MINKTTLIIILIGILIFPSLNAGLFNSKDIKFILDQHEYYFKTGEEAVITMKIENTYRKQIDGFMTAIINQQINQQGFQSSHVKTNSQQFSIADGESEIPLGFGTSDNPLSIKVSLTFSYHEKEDREVKLEDIMIHFVSDEFQKQNEQDKKESSSEKSENQQQNQQNQQQQKQTQQQMQQQQLQNSQMNQDSNALKQQMEKQMEEQKKIEEQFQQQIANNPEFQEMHQELLDKGYEPSKANLNAESNDTGSFELNYEKEGEQASLEGEMEKGEMENLEKFTTEEKKEMLNKLNQNNDFQKFQEKLKKEGFEEQNIEFRKDGNNTLVKIDYKNEINETASIKAEFINKTIENVKLEKVEKNKPFFYWLLLIFLVGFFGFLIYSKYKKKQIILESFTPIEDNFNYKNLSIKMLNNAKRLFKEEKYKDAYGKSAQALRLFLSHKYGLKKEITNDNMVKFLIKNDEPYKKIKECFDLCSLVEFAKYKANKKDFDKIINTAEKIIRKK